MSDSVYKRFEAVEASIRNISTKVASIEEKMEVLIKDGESSKDSQSKIPADLSVSTQQALSRIIVSLKNTIFHALSLQCKQTT